jgi:catechol O-methyltransferase
MNVGDEKGAILDKEVIAKSPMLALELGGYCGYSAIRIARLMPEGSRFISLEINPLFAAIATKLIELAGLSHKVQVIVGAAADSMAKLAETSQGQVDFVLIDHWKDRYLPDAQALLASGLLRDGAVLFADNVVFPGAPDYLAWIRPHPKFTSVNIPSHLEYSSALDAVEVSTYRA